MYIENKNLLGCPIDFGDNVVRGTLPLLLFQDFSQLDLSCVTRVSLRQVKHINPTLIGKSDDLFGVFRVWILCEHPCGKSDAWHTKATFSQVPITETRRYCAASGREGRLLRSLTVRHVSHRSCRIRLEEQLFHLIEPLFVTCQRSLSVCKNHREIYKQNSKNQTPCQHCALSNSSTIYFKRQQKK